MSESQTHRRLKRKDATSRGQIEKPISRNRRLDAKRGNNSFEIEKSGNIKAALRRLKTQRNSKKILRVPQPQMNRAVKLAESENMNVLITNLGKTKRRSVKKG